MERDEDKVREEFRTYKRTGDRSIRDELIEQHIGLARHWRGGSPTGASRSTTSRRSPWSGS